jgi:hypothetical protein
MEDIPCSSKDADQATQYAHTEKRKHGKQFYGGKTSAPPSAPITA